MLATPQPVVTLVNDFSQPSDEIIANPGVEIIREILRRHSHSGREVRRLGPLEHSSELPRSTLRPSCRKLRQVYGFPSKHGEHINVLELRAVINGVFWRSRSAANIHSKGVQAIDSMVFLGALEKGRSASRRLALLVLKFNSLVVAASFTPLLVYCRTDLNSRRGHGKARRKRLRATIGLFA